MVEALDMAVISFCPKTCNTLEKMQFRMGIYFANNPKNLNLGESNRRQDYFGIAKPRIRMVSIGTMLMANQLSGQSNISF